MALTPHQASQLSNLTMAAYRTHLAGREEELNARAEYLRQMAASLNIVEVMQPEEAEPASATQPEVRHIDLSDDTPDKEQSMPALQQKFIDTYAAAIDVMLQMQLTSEEQRQVHIESALYKLLKRYADQLPEIFSSSFHAEFRKTDCVDNDAPDDKGGLMDMVFWNLLQVAKLYWTTYENFCRIYATELKEAGYDLEP